MTSQMIRVKRPTPKYDTFLAILYILLTLIVHCVNYSPLEDRQMKFAVQKF